MEHAEPNNSRTEEEQTGERALANEQSVATNGGPWRLTRRRLLASAATGDAASAVSLPRVISEGATATPTAAAPTVAAAMNMATPAPPSSVTTPAGLEFISPWEASAVQAAAVRLIPTAENGPGATEAGVVYFIDRQLNSPWGLYVRRCNQGPFALGESRQVDRSELNLRDRSRLGLLALDNYSGDIQSELRRAHSQQNAGYKPTGIVDDLACRTADALVTKYLPGPGMLAYVEGKTGAVLQPLRRIRRAGQVLGYAANSADKTPVRPPAQPAPSGEVVENASHPRERLGHRNVDRE
jgi:hypothetical protein